MSHRYRSLKYDSTTRNEKHAGSRCVVSRSRRAGTGRRRLDGLGGICKFVAALRATAALEVAKAAKLLTRHFDCDLLHVVHQLHHRIYGGVRQGFTLQPAEHFKYAELSRRQRGYVVGFVHVGHYRLKLRVVNTL